MQIWKHYGNLFPSKSVLMLYLKRADTWKREEFGSGEQKVANSKRYRQNVWKLHGCGIFERRGHQQTTTKNKPRDLMNSIMLLRLLCKPTSSSKININYVYCNKLHYITCFRDVMVPPLAEQQDVCITEMSAAACKSWLLSLFQRRCSAPICWAARHLHYWSVCCSMSLGRIPSPSLWKGSGRKIRSCRKRSTLFWPRWTGQCFCLSVQSSAWKIYS